MRGVGPVVRTNDAKPKQRHTEDTATRQARSDLDLSLNGLPEEIPSLRLATSFLFLLIAGSYEEAGPAFLTSSFTSASNFSKFSVKSPASFFACSS